MEELTNDRDYAVAVVRKQKQLEQSAAEAVVAALPSEKVKALVEAGRGGDLAKVREILA